MADVGNAKDRSVFLTLLRGGALALMVPLSFDAVMSLLSRSIQSYAPPLAYPLFFVLGIAFALSSLRSPRQDKRTKE